MKYFICGFMGAGKTTALKKISTDEKWFGYSFVDLDQKVFEKYKENHKDLGELIDSKGFDWFRKAEKELLIEVLKLQNVWIALGGGTLDSVSMEFLKNQSNIKGYFLDTPLEVCIERIMEDKVNRPLGKLTKAQLQALYQQRMVNYSKFEPLVIS